MARYADTDRYTADETRLWREIEARQGRTLFTSRGLPYSYAVRGNELFISRRDKSITRATVNMAYHRAQQLMKAEGCVRGPKKIGVFGASYLYPLLLDMGVLRDAPSETPSEDEGQ